MLGGKSASQTIHGTAPKAGENTWLWLIKIASGLLILTLLIVHYIVNHFAGEQVLLTYSDILRYYANPLVPIMEGLFLVFVVAHALLGLRSILLDLHPSRPVLRAINGAFSLVGAVSIVYGIWLLVVVTLRAGAG
jgi:succinate dehydrogenase / fumarate reductase membrane anchor subunit